MMEDFDESLKKLKQAIDSIDLTLLQYDENEIISTLKTLNPLCFAFSKVVPYFERLTINRSLPNNNNETIYDIQLLKNPPDECVNKYGRANLKKQSVLYATFILPTTIFEMKPKVGDIVTTSKWTLKKQDTTLVIYPVIDYPHSKNIQLTNEFTKALSRYPKDLKDIIIADNSLIAKYFSKYVEKGKDINYIFSAHFADRILNEFYGGKIDAIIYPSVQDPASSDNIAIKPEVFNEKYKISEICESIVDTYDGEALFLKKLKTTSIVDLDGTIIWE